MLATFVMRKYWILSILVFLFWCCGNKKGAWFCTEGGLYYEYTAIIPMSVSPNQPVYHVGDTATVQLFWPNNFTDSLSQVSFQFNDQAKVRPVVIVYYLDDDTLYPGNGVDTTFDLTAIQGNAPQTSFGGYPDYYVEFEPVDSGMILQYKIVFHTPGRFFHTIEETSFDEERSWHGTYCLQGETANFYYRVQGTDYYSSISATPRPFDLNAIYNDYELYKRIGGYIFNVIP